MNDCTKTEIGHVAFFLVPPCPDLPLVRHQQVDSGNCAISISLAPVRSEYIKQYISSVAE